MDFGLVGRGERLAAISGIALFVFMFLNWFGLDVAVPAGVPVEIDASFNAWEAFDVIDLVLLLAVLVSIGAALAVAASRDADVPVSVNALTAGIGAIATLLVIYRIIDPPGGEGVGREIGVWLGLLACIGITAGGWMAMQEEGTTFSGEGDRFSGGPGDRESGREPPPPPPPPPPSSGT